MDPLCTCSAGELATVLGLSKPRIYQLVSEGIITKKGRELPLADSVQRYIEYSRHGESTDKVELENARLRADVKYRENKAEIMRLEADELKGRMHRSEDVEALTSDLVYVMRSTMLALIGRLAVDVAPIDNPAECAAVIRKEIYRAMESLSEYRYDPKKYIERVRERRKWEEVMKDDPSENQLTGD